MPNDESQSQQPTPIGQLVREYTTKYEESNLQDEALWEIFQDDFKDLSVGALEKAGRPALGGLRRALRHKGVWVDTNYNNARIAQSLWNTAHMEEQPYWPQAELVFLVNDKQDSSYTSEYLQRRFESVKESSKNPIISASNAPTLLANPNPVISSTADPTKQPASGNVLPNRPNPEQVQQYQFKNAPITSWNRSEPLRQEDGAKEIINLMKAYTDDVKYGQAGDNFALRLTIFESKCKMVSLPESARAKAFPTMLKGLALDYYYKTLLHKDLDYHALQEAVQSRFEDTNFRQTAMLRWNAKSLQQTILENPNKSTAECFDILVNDLQEIFHSLMPKLQNDEFMLNKLVLACRPIPACQAVSVKPPNDPITFVNDMKSSILTYESLRNEARAGTLIQEDEAYYTDRTYRFNRTNGPRTSSRSPASNFRPVVSGNRYPPRKRCFVCHKEGCWSNNHSEAEQNVSRERFKRGLRSTPTGKRFGPKFERFATQFITQWEEESQYNEIIQAVEEAFISRTLNDDNDEDEEEEEPPTTFFTTWAKLPDQQANELLQELNVMSFTHALLASGQLSSRELDLLGSRYSNGTFHGICIDTGAARVSSVGRGQYEAYNTIQRTRLDKKDPVHVKFGKGSTASSIGTIQLRSPIGSITFHVLETDTPFLLCLSDMDRLKVHFNNLTNILHTPLGKLPVVRKFGHPFLTWEESPVNQQNPLYDCFLTDVELRRLHRRFGHPSVNRLRRVLERAGHEVDSAILNHLTKVCHHCQKHGKSPGRFRFTLRDDVEFNYCIIVDIMYISGKPLIHVVDEATRYQAGRWLNNLTAKHLWEKLQECWINTYLGPPDWIVHDAGTNFIAKEFQQNAFSQGIQTRDVPIEAHNSIGIVERYHGPIRRAYEIIAAELPDLDKYAALQMAFKAINDTAGPDGLVPTLLVFGAYPRMAEFDAPSPTTMQRAATLKKAMAEVRRLRAERQVNDALNTRNGPDTSVIKDYPIGELVMVWRDATNSKAGFWDGPFPFWGVEGETCVVGHTDAKFRSTKLKPYHDELGQQDAAAEASLDPLAPTSHVEQVVRQEQEPQPASISERLRNARPPGKNQPKPPLEQPSKRAPGRPRKVHPPEPAANPILPSDTATIFPPGMMIAPTPSDTHNPPRHVITLGPEILTATSDAVHFEEFEEIFMCTGDTMPFEGSRLDEVNGLIERGVFNPIPIQDVPAGVRIFNSRFVDEIKNKGTSEAFEKSRLVIQAYNDTGKVHVLTQSPTIQRASQRVILCLATVLTATDIYLRDITQAYTQSTSNLAREIYARPPPGFDIWINCLLKVIKPLYGIPESGNHWFNTYHKHHLEELQMKQSTFDPCLLSTDEGAPLGIVGLQTDDSLIVGVKAFAEAEEEAIKKSGFTTKPRQLLTMEHPLKFNGGRISLQADGSIHLTQEQHIKTIGLVKTGPVTLVSSRGIARPNVSMKEQYVAQRARGAYVATMTQPEASFDLSFAAQATEPTKDDIKALNQRLQWQLDNSQRGLKFVKLDEESLRIVVFTDGSFANNRDYSSQIGHVIVLADKHNKANVIHWSSTKCRRVTRSVLASELYAMSNGFDIAASLKGTIEGILHRPIPLVACTDSKSLFECLVKLGTTNEKRLMVDVMCLRQSYERREIAEVKWISGDSNPADAMTKSKACGALTQLLDTNLIELKETEWVERGEI